VKRARRGEAEFPRRARLVSARACVNLCNYRASDFPSARVMAGVAGVCVKGCTCNSKNMAREGRRASAARTEPNMMHDPCPRFNHWKMRTSLPTQNHRRRQFRMTQFFYPCSPKSIRIEKHLCLWSQTDLETPPQHHRINIVYSPGYL